MYFRFFRHDDIASCIPLIHQGFKASVQVRAAMPSVLSQWLTNGQLHGGVVVDRPPDGSEAVVACGMTVFLDDAFVEEFLGAPVPYVGARVCELALDGRSPVLTPAALQRANAGEGVNLLVLHFGIHLSAPPTPRELAIVAMAHNGFRLAHEGFHLRRMIQEGYSGMQMAFLQAGGLKLHSDFSQHFAERGETPPPGEYPYLMVAVHEDFANDLPGNTLSFLFRRRMPRLRFSPAEQRVLLHALLDEGDDGIARGLGVSRDAVKKSWRRIYERVAASDPALLEDMSPASARASSRGREKRRRLVQYLRNHLEELRPFKAEQPSR